MRRLWLMFAQAVTIALALLFVVSTLKPEWIGRAPQLAALPAPAPAFVPPPTVALTAAEAPAGETRAVSYAAAAGKALPSVVHVFTSKATKSARHPFADDPIFRHFFGDRGDAGPQRSAGLGSGVIVSAEGYVLTNNHVIEGADEIEVALQDGRKLRARTVGMDPESDLAVLKIQSEDKFSAVSFAAPGSVHVGDVALAIGNPFGVGQTVTMGIVSAMGRTALGINTFEDFIQTDAAINPGNSGGALVDSAGNLIGINTAIYSRSGGSLGIGFAIPVTLARNVMEQIIRTGTVTRGWIGVEVQEITPELADSFGLASREGTLVAGVMRGGPADKAGIRPGDVLIAVDGKAIHNNHTMLDLVAALPPGSGARFRIQRDKKAEEIDVQIGKRPPLKNDG
ncbi:MAG: Do family serine endopeptidase [Sterolibacteriaceae bacterium]|nr:Do family serine endopeptidase [Candidatus Methylophosphatis haderslevensis]